MIIIIVTIIVGKKMKSVVKIEMEEKKGEERGMENRYKRTKEEGRESSARNWQVLDSSFQTSVRSERSLSSQSRDLANSYGL